MSEPNPAFLVDDSIRNSSRNKDICRVADENIRRAVFPHLADLQGSAGARYEYYVPDLLYGYRLNKYRA
jgi:hypothetical protein